MGSSISEIKNEKRQLLRKYLEESNGWNNPLVDRNKDAIFVIDVDGYFVQVNPAFERLVGYSCPEAVQLRLQTLIPIDVMEKTFNYLHKAVMGQFENFDGKMLNKWGRIHDINFMFIPLSVTGKVIGICGVAKDITELKQKDDEVRKIEEIHRALTDHVLDIIISSNLFGEILYITPSCQSILGYTPGELIGTQIGDLVYQDDRDRMKGKRSNVLTYQANGRASCRLLKKDGSIVWTEVLCKVVVDPLTQNSLEMVSVFRDITEQKRVEEELITQKKAFRDLIEHSPDAVIITQNGILQYINQTGIELLRASGEKEIIHRSILDFLHPDYHQTAIKRARNIFNGKNMGFNEYKLIGLDGTVIEAEMKGVSTLFNDEPAHYIYIRDLTERKKTQKLLLQSEKLSIAGQLAAGIAHEVRNPLTAIKGFLQLLESELIEKKSYLDIIQSEIERIELILTELLSLAKSKELNIETVDIRDLLRDIKTLFDTQAVISNIEIDICFESQEPLLIQCDKNQLKQVFINFLKNALEAMKYGGRITIETKRHGFDKLKIFVKDTGTGIPPHILKRIGEPFFTTKENGTGLGVMFSKQIVENHHGSCHIWSDQHGTIIEVILPIH